MKKRALTLLEMMIAITLLSFLLTGLFQTYFRALKKNIEAKMLKQKTLQLELFQQKMKVLLMQEEGIWIDKHTDIRSPVLFVEFEQKVDPDFNLRGKMLGMLYLNGKKELCFVRWSKDGNFSRIETLLDNVSSFTCKLFDSKKGLWSEKYPKNQELPPSMVSIDLVWKGNKIPFVFFLYSKNEKIVYKAIV